MARSRETKIELTAYDDLFQTDESREEAKLSKIRDIPISEIDEFPDHPFKVLMDEDMEQLVESIKRNGVMTPETVRLKEDGWYELISGHRRKKACELAGLETLKCEVKELTRDEAIIVMVESNLQRSVILPSEKAFAYKMRLEAMKRQAGRPAKENYSPVGNNSEFATSIVILPKVTIWLYTVITSRVARCLERWRITSPRASMRNTKLFSLIPSQSRQSMKSSLYLRLWRIAPRASDTTTLLMRRMRKNLIPMSGSARSLLCMIQV